MSGFQNHLVRGQRELRFDQAPGFTLVVAEKTEQHLGIRVFEVIRRLFDLVLMEHIAVSERTALAVFFPLGPDQVIDVFDALQVHREPLDAIRDLAEHWLAI